MENKKILIDNYLDEGIEYVANCNFKKAYDCFNNVLKIDPDNSDALNNLGFLFSEPCFEFYDKKKAIEYFEKSDNGIAHSNLAYIYEGKNIWFSFLDYNDKEKAFEHYRTAVSKGCSGAKSIGFLTGNIVERINSCFECEFKFD